MRVPFVVVAALVALGLARSAGAQSLASGDGECPSAAAVEQGMLRLIPLEQRAALREHAVHVELTDTNDSYRVKVSKDGVDVSKTYLDTARDCANRENIAAVFAVLTVLPPELGLSPEPAVEAPPPPPPVPPPSPAVIAAPPPEPHLVHIELGGLAVSSPAILDAPAISGVGGELRVAFGRHAYALTLSLGYLPRARFELDGVQGRVTRLPASVGVRWRRELDAWAVQLDFGALAVSDQVRESNLLRSEPRGSFDAGLRAGFTLAPAGNPRLAPFLGVFAWGSLLSREIAAEPQGTLGKLPQLWLGGTLGVSLGL